MAIDSTSEIKKLQAENASLKAQIEDYYQLYQVLETVSSFIEVNDVIEHITKEALDLCQADQGAILLFDPAERSEAKTLIRHAEPDAIKLDHFLNMMLAGWVKNHQQTLVSEDLASVVGKDFVKKKYEDVRGILSVPLTLRSKMIGVLNLIRLRDQPAFGEREMQLLTVLATIFGQFIHNAKLHDEVFAETVRLRQEVQKKFAVHGIIGQSPQLQSVFSVLDRVIPTDARVLIEGESGTGKELIAKVIHYSGPRKDNPFVAIDCGALPANLLESELFGYVKGAFTGAMRDKQGLFEAADGGTLFLDEIVSMPLEIQSKFLRAIQEMEIRPVGSTKVKKINVRVISAASSNLREKLENGEFRQDLYYRLNIVTVQLPPLRHRSGDIPLLADHFLQKLAKRHHKKIKGFKPETMAHLEAYEWRGNVRELENVVERMIILTEDDREYIPVDVLPMEIRPRALQDSGPDAFANPAAKDLKHQKAHYEKAVLLEALVNNKWNQSAAARELNVSERTVRYMMKKYAIQKPK